jgi:hypothetical protein
MSELQAAVDETNDGEYLAFIIGDEKSVLVNWQKLPPDFTHMTHIKSKSEKQKILASFDFSGNILASCIKFGLPEVRKQIDRMGYSKKLRKHGTGINRGIGYEILNTVKTTFGNFVTSNGLTLQDIIFEADNKLDLLRN